MPRKKKGRPLHGWLVIDKAQGLTSTQALGKARRLFDAQKAGHGGTLDPMATGVLPIAFGEATKTVQYAMDGAKRYEFTLRWGQATDTDDAEGTVTATSEARPTPDAIAAALPRFIGHIEQTPPRFSAIKVAGERAYDIARDGDTVDLAPRTIRIDGFRLLDMVDADHARFEVVSGKGAYMRALARDLAVALGTVGHLSALRRTRVGPFSLDDAVTLEHLAALVADAGDDPASGRRLDDRLLPIEAPLDDIPALALTEDQAARLRNGQPVGLFRRSEKAQLDALALDPAEPDPVVLATCRGTPVALSVLSGAELHPVRVLNL